MTERWFFRTDEGDVLMWNEENGVWTTGTTMLEPYEREGRIDQKQPYPPQSFGDPDKPLRGRYVSGESPYVTLHELVQRYESHEAFVAAVTRELQILATRFKGHYYSSGDGLQCKYNTGHLFKRSNTTNVVECGCIIGTALTRLGWSHPEERDLNCTVSDLFRWLVPDFTVPAAWRRIQEHQDGGHSWDIAVNFMYPLDL